MIAKTYAAAEMLVKDWTNGLVALVAVAAFVVSIASYWVADTLWGEPRLAVLVIATGGRFTMDAVSVIEKRNTSDRALKIEMWPESQLERLLASHPAREHHRIALTFDPIKMLVRTKAQSVCGASISTDNAQAAKFSLR